MAYTGNNQVSVSTSVALAVAGMLADTGIRDVVSRFVSAAGDIDAGRIVISSSTTEVEYPDADADVLSQPVGLTVYDPIREPNTSVARFKSGADVPVLRFGRGWAELKTSTPAKNDPVYVYVGATTADRGKVSKTAAAGYVALPGARFTGRLEGTSFAEIQFGDAMAPLFGGVLQNLQIVTGTLVAGDATLNTVKVTANTFVIPVPTAAITGSVNFACIGNIKASNVVGDIGVGSLLIRAFDNTGAKDVDAAGAFVAFVFN